MRIKINWLNPERTEAVLIKGWLFKKSTKIFKERGNYERWKWASTNEALSDFYHDFVETKRRAPIWEPYQKPKPVLKAKVIQRYQLLPPGPPLSLAESRALASPEESGSYRQ